MYFKAKIYSTDEHILSKAAKDFNVKLVFLREGEGKGYVLTEGSCVDLDLNTPDITDRYIVVKTQGRFLL